MPAAAVINQPKTDIDEIEGAALLIAQQQATAIIASQTANQFYNNTNTKPMMPINSNELSVQTANQWTAQEKIYLNALNSIGVNLFDELAIDYGTTLRYVKRCNSGKPPYCASGYVADDGSAKYNPKSFTVMSDTTNIIGTDYLNWVKYYLEVKGTTLSAWLQKVMLRNGLAVSTPTSPITTTPTTPTGGGTTTTPNNPINPAVIVTATKPELQQKLIAIANSFDNNKWHMAAYMKQFVNNDANLQAMTDAVSLYGYPAFAGTIVNKDGNTGWNNVTMDWICLARYLQQYPLPTANTSCTAGSAAIALLEGEDKNIANEVALGGNAQEAQSKQKALNTVKTAYNSWYAKSDCAQKIVTQQETKQQEQQQQQQAQSNADVLKALGQAGTDVSNTSNITKYAIIGIGGVILLTGIIVLLKN